jgi:hypothetical protein
MKPNALHCPKCGKEPVTLRYHQSVRCLRSINECNLEQQTVTLRDDDDSTEVLSEDHHTFICEKGHEWIADDNCIEW